jgi:outer membrane lipoprotein-sorting protein
MKNRIGFKKIVMHKVILLITLVFVSLNAQIKDPDQILDKVKKEFSSVKDYEVNVNIKVDVEFLKIPETSAKIYFKQPDKIHFESERFALLPKEGLDITPVGLLKEKYSAIYQKEDTVNGKETSVIKVIPLNEKSDIVLTTLWIDQTKNIIRKAESTTKINGTFTIELKYDNKLNYPLPSEMIFSFNIDRMNIPRGISGEIESGNAKDKKSKNTTGRVFINYSNYKVNQGIPDKIFEDKK